VPRPALLSVPGAATISMYLQRSLCSKPSDTLSEGIAKRKVKAQYEKAQENKTLHTKPMPKRISPLREAYEAQQAALRPGELPGVASLGGLGEFSLAEAQIQRAMHSGQMSNLSGSNKPLQRNDEENLRLWVDDAGMRVINRILQTNGFKPRSLELREVVEHEIRSLRASIRRVKKTSVAAHRAQFAASSEVQALAPIADSCNATISAYNDAVLKDLVTYGSAWPLAQRSKVSLVSLAEQVWAKEDENCEVDGRK